MDDEQFNELINVIKQENFKLAFMQLIGTICIIITLTILLTK